MKPFVPQNLPLQNINWTRFIKLLSSANRELARYDELLQSVPNARVLFSPLTTQEAVLSSRIEGTQATLQEVLKYEAKPQKETERTTDIHEIINYRRALQFAVDELDRRPVSLNLIKKHIAFC